MEVDLKKRMSENVIGMAGVVMKLADSDITYKGSNATRAETTANDWPDGRYRSGEVDG